MALSLSNLLIELGYKQQRKPLTLGDIITTIDIYRKTHNRNPNKSSGNIEEGPLAGLMTWDGLYQSMPIGANGLSNDPAWQEWNRKVGDKNFTMLTLLMELGYKNPPLQLTMQLITETIEAYRKAHNRNPNKNSGNIEEGPLAGLTTWGGLNKSFRYGENNLSKDLAWQALNNKFENKNLSIPVFLVELGYKDPSLQLTMQLIIETIEAFRVAHNQKFPHKASGNIKEGPLSGLISWASLNAAIVTGGHRLSEDPAWHDFCTNKKNKRPSLYGLLIELGYKEPPLHLTMQLIIDTIEAFREAHNKQNPTPSSGNIEEGPLAGLITWSRINKALVSGGYNLSADSIWQEYDRKLGKKNLLLSNFLIELGYKEIPLHLTVEIIIETIEAYIKTHHGKIPIKNMGDIKEGPLDSLTTWSSLHDFIRRGSCGLSDDLSWEILNKKYQGKLSLSKLVKEFFSGSSLQAEISDTYTPAP